MTNNQQESHVRDWLRDWLIEHYTNNDVRFSEKAKAEMLAEHPELVYETNPDRIKIEAFCQREPFLKREQKYFTIPFGPPSAEEAITSLPLRYLYRDLVSLIGTEIAQREAKIENNEQMQDIWGNALVTALLIKPVGYFSLYYPQEGFPRLEVIYRRFQLGYGASEGKLPQRLDLQFVVKFSNLELEYLRSVHDSAVPRVPDARQKAEIYLNSVPGLNRPQDKLTIP